VEVEGLDRAGAEAALFGGTTLFAPIRHHSPACAWHLRAMVRVHRPEVILVEAPADLLPHARHLTDPETRFPVAIMALGGAEASGRRPLRFFPFSEHAPETVAVQEAARLGAELRFIDLPSGARLTPGEPGSKAFQSEAPFDQAAFVAAACARLGLRDGTELWDHLFETRLGDGDWRGFFAGVLAYCAAIRASTPAQAFEEDDTLPREAAMRAHLAEIRGRRAVVVTGGFHTPALLGAASAPTAAPTELPAESYLVAYGEEALDALSGYAAGLRHPGWYAGLWRAALAADGPPDWEAHALATAQGLARAQAAQGRPIALPQLVETLALASGLARMKGRSAVLLPDLLDGLRTALVKGEAGPGEPWTESFHGYLRGTRLGAVPRAAGQPPIVADARARARALRFDLSDSVRRPRRLDIRRKESHAEASRFLHRMALLDTGFGTLVAGPDGVQGLRTDLLFEEWEVAWSPFVEGRLIEAARLGPTLADAALARLMEQRRELVAAGRGDDLSALTGLLLSGMRAGLGTHLPPLARELSEAIWRSADLSALAETMRRLHAAATPDDLPRDPAGPDFDGLLLLAYDRAVLLCDVLPATPTDALAPWIDALGLVAALLRGPLGERLGAGPFDEALSRVAEAPACPPLLLGAVLGLLGQAGLCGPERVGSALRGGLAAVGVAPEARAGVLDGLLRTAPSLLWESPLVLRAAEEALSNLDDDAFLAALPALRRSFTQLNPHETDRLAKELAALIGPAPLARTSRHSEPDLRRGLALDRTVRRLLDADGLGHWAAP